MTYNQALHTGSVLDGYVKCTYATIHDPSGGNFFSFNQPRKNEYVVSGVGAYKPDVDENFFFIYDLPIFRAVDPVEINEDQPGTLVPVKLTADAYGYMMIGSRSTNMCTMVIRRNGSRNSVQTSIRKLFGMSNR